MITIVLNQNQAEALSALLYCGISADALRSLGLMELQQELHDKFPFRIVNMKQIFQTDDDNTAKVGTEILWEGITIDVS